MEFKFSKQKLTIDELASFEKEFKIKLPESYKDVILKNNGGSPERRYFRGGGIYFRYIKYGDNSLEKAIKLLEDILPENFFPFAEYGGTSYCISLNRDENYGKIYWVTEDGESELVCDSFEEFMEELSNNEDY